MKIKSVCGLKECYVVANNNKYFKALFIGEHKESLETKVHPMQVFICSSNPEKSVHFLDSKRLNKQILESFQIITGRLPNKNHPAYLFWSQPHTVNYLRQYQSCLCAEYTGRFPGKVHSCLSESLPYKGFSFYEVIPNVRIYILSHRVNLLRKNPDWYSRFFPLKEDIDKYPEGYYWPLYKGKVSEKHTKNWISFFESRNYRKE